MAHPGRVGPRVTRNGRTRALGSASQAPVDCPRSTTRPRTCQPLRAYKGVAVLSGPVRRGGVPSVLGRGSAPGRIRTADAGLRTAALYPLSYGGATAIVPRRAAR